MTIDIHRDCGITTASNILATLGYKEDDRGYFTKDNIRYTFASWNHFNSYVYSIKLRKARAKH